MRLIKIVFVVLSIYNTGFSQNYIGDEKEIDIILENGRNFSNYIITSNYEMIIDSYTNDAKIFPNNSPIIQGGDSILAYWRLPGGVHTVHHELTPIEIKIIGGEAYDYGYYEGVTRKIDGTEIAWKGKYVVVWRKEGDTWKMYLDIWNSVP